MMNRIFNFMITAIVFLIANNLVFAQKKEKSYIPQVFYDKEDAISRLKNGKSTIKGVAYGKDAKTIFGGGVLGKKQYAENVNVVLYPFTPYIEEWYRINVAHKSANVLIEDGVLDQKRKTTTDEFGNFVFDKLKPGKYLLLTQMDILHTRTASQKTGAWVNGYGMEVSAIYSSFKYSYFTEELAHKIVEIKSNGEFLEVNLTTRTPFIEFVSVGKPANNDCYVLRNQLCGKCNLFYPNGNLRATAEFDNGLFDGVLTNYNENGTIANKVKMKKNVPDGDLVFYNEKGLPAYKQSFIKGKKSSLLVVYMYDKNNKLHYDNSFKYEGEVDDITPKTKLVKEGEFHLYYPDGKVKELNVYKDDFLVSVMLYDQKGKAKKIGETVNGKFNGDYIYYNDNGKPIQVETWSQGVKVSTKKI